MPCVLPSTPRLASVGTELTPSIVDASFETELTLLSRPQLCPGPQCWNEDVAGAGLRQTGRTQYNYGAPIRSTSTQQESYNEMVRLHGAKRVTQHA